MEAEQYFTTLYKTQVNELTDEVDDAKEREREIKSEKDTLLNQLKSLAGKMESEALARRVAEEDIAELEKEKMMVELELEEVNAKNKAALRNLEMQLAASKDTESDLLQRLDLMAKDNDELVSKVNTLQEDLDVALENQANYENTSDVRAEINKMEKLLQTEKMLKQQAVNKLAEIMNRKDNLSRKDKKAESKASSAELRKKEKENRRLQQELTTEKDKFNQMVAKYQKDLQDLQVKIVILFDVPVATQGQTFLDL